MYESEFELEAELEELMAVLAGSNLESEADMFAPPVPMPLFDVQCMNCEAGECVPCREPPCVECPLLVRKCRSALTEAILKAIMLVQNAADKIEETIGVRREFRGQRAQETAETFKLTFCHDPLDIVPWAGGPSGATVARRFRAVAHELDGARGQRRIRFVCRPTVAACQDGDHLCCADGDFARTIPGVSVINLCNEFWNQDADHRAGIIIHEMLHMLYALEDETFFRTRRIPTPRRFDAYCYQAFVLWINDIPPDDYASAKCSERKCVD